VENELPAPELAPAKPDVAHPSGKEKKSQLTQWLRGLSFVAYFLTCCVAYAFVLPSISICLVACVLALCQVDG
jgi:hypothetical protein